MERLFTATEVSELFQIHREVVYAEVKAGRLRAVRIGKGRREYTASTIKPLWR